MPTLLKRLLPWFLSLGIVGFLFATTDIAAVGEALKHADWGRLVGFMALVTIASYIADSLTLTVLLRRFAARVSVGEVFAIKGVSYFFNAINYSLAAGAIAWIVSRKHKVPFLNTFSSMIWFFFVDIIALGVMLAVGYAIARDMPTAAAFTDKIPIVLLVIAAVVTGSLIYWNGRFDFFIAGRFRDWRIFDTFGRAKLSDYPTLVLMRVCMILVYVCMHWLLLPAFGVHIGLDALLMYAPLIAFVQVIPATVSGLGAVQGVIVALFVVHVPAGAGDPRAVIIAYSTVIGPLMMVMRLVVGYLFVSTVAKDLVPKAADIKAQQEAL